LAQNRRSGSHSTHVVIKHRRCGAARPRPKAHGTEALRLDRTNAVRHFVGGL
jgi:hypothetical protein